MTLSEFLGLHAQWKSWRHERIAQVTHPYGWSSPVAQHWLAPKADHVPLPGLPGSWSILGGTVVHHPSPTGDALEIHGTVPREAFDIPVGRYLASGHPDASPVMLGRREVDAIKRETDAGEFAYAVRVRDPEAARSHLAHGLTFFAPNPAYRVPATFTPHSPSDVVRETVEEGVIDRVSSIGTLSFSLLGHDHTLIVFARPTPLGIVPYTHVRDATSGKETHGNGRMVDLAFRDTSQDVIDVIDFNTAYSLPCSFTPYVSCPVPIPENTLRVRIEAGERTPAPVTTLNV